MMGFFKEIITLQKRRLLSIKNAFCRKRLPRELQFPITYKCNFNCIMCGMQNLIKKSHMTPDEMERLFKNRLFRKIERVGINGGEPFIRNDLCECVDKIINSLPKLTEIYIISNGFLTNKILDCLPKIKHLTTLRHIKLTVSFSVDGINKMQDFMRGMESSFENVSKTLDTISSNASKYCDALNIICTITKHNVFNLNEVELWAKEKGLTVSYNVATIHERIANKDRYNNFSIFTDEKACFVAREFFYKKYLETKEEKYYGLFLICKEGKRFSGCTYMHNDGVTITPDGMLCYCATHSGVVGDALNGDAHKIFFSNKRHQKEIRKQYCGSCSHYLYRLDANGFKRLFDENNKRRMLYLYQKRRQKK